MKLARFDGFILCCSGGVGRLICLADNVNHLLPGPLVNGRLCDAHDRRITHWWESVP